jgi:hypothetical protein
MGLLLRPDCYHAETPDGLYLLSDRGESFLAGPSVHRVFARLAPLLDGRHTLAELTGHLDPQRRAMLERLVAVLIERAVVVDTDAPAQPARPTATVTGEGELAAAVAVAAERAGIACVRAAGAARTAACGVDLTVSGTAAGAVPLGGYVWLTGSGMAWPSVRRRLRARQAIEPDQPGMVREPALSVLAGQLVRIAVGQDASGRVGRLDLSTLDTADYPVLSHPFERPVVAARPVAELRRAARIAVDDFDRGAARCAGGPVGVIGTPAERDFAQVPMHVCEAAVADPVGLAGPAGVVAVTAAGPDFATARHRTALAALATYGSLMLDPRRLASIDGRPVDSSADPDALLEALRQGRSSGTVAAYSVADGSLHHLDAAVVFPALRPAGSAYQAPDGVAAGYDWEEAVERGLLAHCRRLALAAIPAAGAPFPAVAPADADLDPEGRRCLALLAAVGEPVTVHDITGDLGVPTMLCLLGSTAAGAASDRSAADAVTGALGQALLRHQAHADTRAEYAPPPVPDLPQRLRGGAGPLRADLAGGLAAVAAVLLANGYRALAVPLDHDAEVHTVMPNIVHVVLHRD